MSVTIRFAEPRDAGAILAIYAPYCETTAVSFEIAAPTVDQMAERITTISARYPWLVGEVNGRVAGYVYACRHRERAAYRWAVDGTVYVDRAHQRRGLGRALYSSLLKILRVQGYFKAYAGITLPNPASVGLHEAMGFRQIATYANVGFKVGRWHDVGWWQLELQRPALDPPEPTPIAALRGLPSIAAALADGERLLRQ